MSGSNNDPFSGSEDSYSDPIKTVLSMMKLVQISTIKADVID